MKKFCMVVLLMFFVFMLGAEKEIQIKVKKTRIKSKPDFLSSTVKEIMFGSKITVVKKEGSWLLVKTAGGSKGYLHRSAVEERKYKLTGKIPGKNGVSSKEVAMAAKGFGKGNEKRLRSAGKGYNFRDLDYIIKLSVGLKELRTFIRKGGLK